MNPEFEERSAAEADRLLKELPELAAPASLAPRVMDAIRRRAAQSWRGYAWENWPRFWQAAVLAGLVMLFSALLLTATNVVHIPVFAMAGHQLTTWAADAGAAGHVLLDVLNAAILAVKHLGTTIIFAALAVAIVAYVSCVGLGTLCVRYAFARR